MWISKLKSYPSERCVYLTHLNDFVVFLIYDRVLAHPMCTVVGSIFVKISPDEGEGYITYGRTPTPKIFRVPPPPN